MKPRTRPVARAILLGAGATVAALVLREAIQGDMPGLRAQMVSRREQMMAAMPEWAPPVRIQRDLTAIREQTARILQLLEEQPQARS